MLGDRSSQLPEPMPSASTPWNIRGPCDAAPPSRSGVSVDAAATMRAASFSVSFVDRPRPRPAAAAPGVRVGRLGGADRLRLTGRDLARPSTPRTCPAPPRPSRRPATAAPRHPHPCRSRDRASAPPNGARRASTDRSAPPDEPPTPPPPRPDAPTARTPPPAPARHEPRSDPGSKPSTNDGDRIDDRRGLPAPPPVPRSPRRTHTTTLFRGCDSPFRLACRPRGPTAGYRSARRQCGGGSMAGSRSATSGKVNWLLVIPGVLLLGLAAALGYPPSQAYRLLLWRGPPRPVLRGPVRRGAHRPDGRHRRARCPRARARGVRPCRPGRGRPPRRGRLPDRRRSGPSPSPARP